MRKWLIGLGIAAAAAGIAGLRKIGRRTKAHDLLGRFIRALEQNELEAVMNETTVGADGWTDIYAGSVGGKPFHFWMKAPVGRHRVEQPGSRRRYRLQWGSLYVEASAAMSDGEPHVLERIHDLLRREYHRLAGIRPS